MTTHIDTIVGNKGLSEKLTGMLVDLRDTIGSAFETIEDKIEKINAQAHSEGFEDYEIELLLRMYLSGVKTKRQLKWILTDKPRIKEQKKLMENGDINVPIEDNNVPDIPQPDYKIVIPDQVIEEELEQLTEEYKPDYTLEDLRSQIENYKSRIEELTTQCKTLEEKYKQLEAKTRVSPSNYIPAVQGNYLRTKVVVSQIFREVLVLKGSKMIYANVLIDISQNKYIRLEPV
jgi:DNA repair exonuclease SbcCD ATPase subunit